MEVCPHLIFVGRESKEESKDQIWYNSCMIQMIFNLSSHLLFIFFAYYLLMNLVQWEKFLKVSAENAVKIRFFILMISVGIGYLASSFFISVYEMSRSLLESADFYWPILATFYKKYGMIESVTLRNWRTIPYGKNNR